MAKELTELEKHYNKFNEEKRRGRRHGQVEYRITMEYIHRYLKEMEQPKILDVGAGTGSVSLEAALHGENLRVYAIEKNPDGAELIRKNMQKFRADQIQVIEGVAPEALEALEMPTHAFIGGSTGQLKEIIQCIKKKNPDVRIVINAISLETVKEAMEAMEEGLLADPEIIQLNVEDIT